MDYDTFISNIINTRGQWNIPPGQYYETHHILPKCLGGLPNNYTHDIHGLKHENLIWLYPNEHYIAHKLLIEKYKDNKKLIFAFWFMSNKFNEFTNKYEYISEHDYAEAKQLLHTIKFGVPQEESTNKKRSDTMKSKKLIWFTDGVNEVRCSERYCPPGFYKGRSERISKNNSIKCKERNLHLFGEKNGMYGKRHTEETKAKMSNWSSQRSWFNNGVIEVFEMCCPDGFVPGRLQKIIGQKKKLWLLPDGSKKAMRECMVKKYHTDWVLIGDID